MLLPDNLASNQGKTLIQRGIQEGRPYAKNRADVVLLDFLWRLGKSRFVKRRSIKKDNVHIVCTEEVPILKRSSSEYKKGEEDTNIHLHFLFFSPLFCLILLLVLFLLYFSEDISVVDGYTMYH
jgi:hypothetical protein